MEGTETVWSNVYMEEKGIWEWDGEVRTPHSHRSQGLLGVIRIFYDICICDGNECLNHSKWIKIHTINVLFRRRPARSYFPAHSEHAGAVLPRDWC